MHIRGEFRARALDDPKRQQKAVAADRRHAASGTGDGGERHDGRGGEGRRGDKGGDTQGEDRSHRQMYDELSYELLAVFDGILQPLGEPPPDGGESGEPAADDSKTK